MTIMLTLTVATVTVVDGRAVLTASVTNSGTVPARIVLGAFGPVARFGASGAGASGGGVSGVGAVPTAPPTALMWTSIDRPLRDVAAGATEQYAVAFAPPPATAAGNYPVRFIAYSADQAPEEYADQARQVDVVVPAVPVVAPAKKPWWPWAAAAALVLVVALVSWFALRGGSPAEPAPSVTTPGPTTTAPSVPLEGTVWQLAQFEDGTTPVAGTKVTLSFKDGRVNGRACNSFGGTATVTGSDVAIGPLATTLMFCTGEGVMAQEHRVTGTLAAVTTLSQSGTSLILKTADGRSLTFTAS